MTLNEGIIVRTFGSPANAFKILASYGVGLVAVFACILFAIRYGQVIYIDVLLCVFGGTTGWIFGLYVTPSSEGEKEQFSDFGKTFIAFVSGFGLASVKDFMEWSAITKEDVTSDVTIFRLLIFACMFLLGSLFTYISRRHVRGPDDERRDKRASLIVKMEKHLQALKSES